MDDTTTKTDVHQTPGEEVTPQTPSTDTGVEADPTVEVPEEGAPMMPGTADEPAA